LTASATLALWKLKMPSNGPASQRAAQGGYIRPPLESQTFVPARY
jgi:hypothetical protein